MTWRSEAKRWNTYSTELQARRDPLLYLVLSSLFLKLNNIQHNSIRNITIAFNISHPPAHCQSDNACLAARHQIGPFADEPSWSRVVLLCAWQPGMQQADGWMHY